MAKRNKMLRKVLVTMCSAVLLVGATVGVTMAYLTKTTQVVTNTFTVGSVTIDLDEAKVDLYGEEDTTADRVKANTYKLIPGHTYTKDPEVHVAAGSEKCWLFVKVENGLAAIEDATKIADQMNTKGWTLVDGQTNVYAYANIVDAREQAVTVPVFDTFKITGTANVADYATANITIQAYAVQADGFTTAAAAWAAAPSNWTAN